MIVVEVNTVADMPKDYIPKQSIFHHDYRAGFSRHKRKNSGDITAAKQIHFFLFSSSLLGALPRKRLKESVGPQIRKAYEEEVN